MGGECAGSRFTWKRRKKCWPRFSRATGNCGWCFLVLTWWRTSPPKFRYSGRGKSLHLVNDWRNGADDWLPIVDETLGYYARQMGCRQVSSSGRRGWSRKLDKLGWRDVAIVRTKEV